MNCSSKLIRPKEQVIGTSDPLPQSLGDNLDLGTGICSAEVMGKSCMT